MNDKKVDLEAAHGVRSRILNYSILIEMRLEDFIRDYFVDNNDKKLRFGELVIHKEFFTFEQKIRVFEKIIYELKDKKFDTLNGEYDLTNNKKELIKKIKHIREIRNATAHIHPFRNEGTNDIAIIYHFGGKSKEIILNDKFGMEIFKEYSEVDDILRSLSRELFER